MELTSNPVTCRTHPDTTVGSFCAACVGPYCKVCLFETPRGTYCPDCMTRPAEHQRAAAAGRGALSIVGAGTGLFFLMVLVLWETVSGEEMNEVLASFVGLLALAGILGGLTFGLISRDQSRGTGSVLATIGVWSNGALLVLYLGLTLLGLSMD
jgi:hypothetical protein